jgi:hypothetical protein
VGLSQLQVDAQGEQVAAGRVRLVLGAGLVEAADVVGENLAPGHERADLAAREEVVEVAAVDQDQRGAVTVDHGVRG